MLIRVLRLYTTINPDTESLLGGSKMVSISQSNITGGSIMNKAKSIVQRVVAVFLASGLSVIGAGAIIGIDTIKAVILAGTLGVVTVVEQLARSFLVDGKLSTAEINEAFSDVDGKTANRKGK